MRSEPAVLAEFETAEAIERAVDALHEAGYVRMEAYTPHPLPKLEAKLGIGRSRIPRHVLAGGAVGAVFAFLLQYWLNGVNYPLNVGGRPLFSAPAFVPITFETTVLFASLTAFAAWLAVSRLPTLDEPILTVEGFSATIDRFWLAVAAAESSFDSSRCAECLREAGALRIVFMPEVHA
jgi:Protein of unknown function (DUF3341)